MFSLWINSLQIRFLDKEAFKKEKQITNTEEKQRKLTPSLKVGLVIGMDF